MGVDFVGVDLVGPNPFCEVRGVSFFSISTRWLLDHFHLVEFSLERTVAWLDLRLAVTVFWLHYQSWKLRKVTTSTRVEF